MGWLIYVYTYSCLSDMGSTFSSSPNPHTVHPKTLDDADEYTPLVTPLPTGHVSLHKHPFRYLLVRIVLVMVAIPTLLLASVSLDVRSNIHIYLQEIR